MSDTHQNTPQPHEPYRDKKLGLAGRLAKMWLDSKLTPLVIVSSLALGAFAAWKLPREEEPQIVVPMIDVFVTMPGSPVREVEERVTKPLEKLLWEIPGVEYIYSTTSPGQAMAIVRFKVGENEEASIVRLNQKLNANLDLIPPGASMPLVKPRSIDDVPILALTLTSAHHSDFQLRQLAEQFTDTIKQADEVSEVKILGGQRRQLRVTPDETKLAAYHIDLLQVLGAIGQENVKLESGLVRKHNQEVIVETGELLATADDVRGVVAGVANGRPIFLRDIAKIEDASEDPSQYVQYATKNGVQPAVTITVAKKKATNAIDVADRVLAKVDGIKPALLPRDVELHITRHYGETAAEKSNELLEHMAIAVVSVSVLILLVLGFRESIVVFTAIPVTLALTLLVFYLYGYTLNRITLFALIFSIGILVDDAIVIVENLARHAGMYPHLSLKEVAVGAVDEVGNPTILATLTVVAAILPMAFVGGLMGPYMRPIPIGASAAMIFSLIVAFVVTPWAAVRVLKHGGAHHDGREDFLTRVYRKVMGPLLGQWWVRWLFLGGVAVLLLGAMALVYVEFVQVKMLPFDNKSEFQVVIDMPEGTTLEQTARVARELTDPLLTLPEVTDLQTYTGTSAPYNFNGLVRHYFLRQGPNVADIQVNLLPKGERDRQSHEIAKQARQLLDPVAKKFGARIKVAEVPPGPPVLATLVAEIYGPTQEGQRKIAKQVLDLMDHTDGVVDADWYVEAEQDKRELRVDAEKAALSGISIAEISRTLRAATEGEAAGLLHVASSKEDVPIYVRLNAATRSDWEKLRSLRVRGVPIGELVREEMGHQERNIYHKNLMPVTYVTADVAGAMESPVYAILALGPKIAKIPVDGGYEIEQWTAHQPFEDQKYAMKWDGEWHITYEVFRDLGIAFAAVMVLIYVLVVGWFQSFTTPLIIMAAIPFSLVGILPAHGLLHAFFTATSMIGFIAGAGIVVRNSIILVDFIELRLAEGSPLAQAVIDAGAVRFRPMVLTAAAVVVGSIVILFDPIFQGLAISLMAGEIASLLLSRMTVPVLYFMYQNRSAKR